MPPGGYILLSRKFFESWLWTEEREFSRAEAFQDLVMSAAWAPYSRAVKGHVIAFERGEVLGSLRYLAERWGWSVKRVRVFVAQLEKKGTLRAQRETQAGHVYLLVNYDSYQSNGHGEGTASDGGRAQRGHSEGTARAQRKTSEVSEANETTKAEERSSCPTATPSDAIARPVNGHAKVYPDDFLAFYGPYPRHEAKDDALKAWKATAKARPPIEEIVAAIEAQKKSDNWRKEGGKFIPLPATWLRAGRWADSLGIEGVQLLPLERPRQAPSFPEGRHYAKL